MPCMPTSLASMSRLTSPFRTTRSTRSAARKSSATASIATAPLLSSRGSSHREGHSHSLIRPKTSATSSISGMASASTCHRLTYWLTAVPITAQSSGPSVWRMSRLASTSADASPHHYMYLCTPPIRQPTTSAIVNVSLNTRDCAAFTSTACSASHRRSTKNFHEATARPTGGTCLLWHGNPVSLTQAVVPRHRDAPFACRPTSSSSGSLHDVATAVSTTRLVTACRTSSATRRPPSLPSARVQRTSTLTYQLTPILPQSSMRRQPSLAEQRTRCVLVRRRSVDSIHDPLLAEG